VSVWASSQAAAVHRPTKTIPLSLGSGIEAMSVGFAAGITKQKGTVSAPPRV
jgi:hypothetical protein